MLTRLLDAAARLDRVAGPRLFEPLARLDQLVSLVVRLLQVAVLRGARQVAGALALPVLAALHRFIEQHLLPPSARVRRAPVARHARPSRGRELALAGAVLVALVAAASGAPAAPAQRAVPAAAERPEPAELVLRDDVEAVAGRPEARPAPPEPTEPAAVDAPAPPAAAPTAPVQAAPVPAAPQARWLPSGTGMWLHEWQASESGSGPAVVARALAGGLSHLYVQTGSTRKGWIGDQVLSELLPATAGTGIEVIAWDFPELIDPEADALRMARAATWQVAGLPRVAAVAPDIETSAEGASSTPDAVNRYYATLRAALPAHIAVLATVPWPSEKRIGSYPYAETAALSDAFVPMAYWYNRDPSVVTSTSMQYLARFGLPVMPVGQGYDGRIDAPSLAEDPDPAGSVQAFVDAARAGGAASISLWSWQTTGVPQWDALVRAGAGPWPAVSTSAPAPPG